MFAEVFPKKEKPVGKESSKPLARILRPAIPDGTTRIDEAKGDADGGGAGSPGTAPQAHRGSKQRGQHGLTLHEPIPRRTLTVPSGSCFQGLAWMLRERRREASNISGFLTWPTT